MRLKRNTLKTVFGDYNRYLYAAFDDNYDFVNLSRGQHAAEVLFGVGLGNLSLLHDARLAFNTHRNHQTARANAAKTKGTHNCGCTYQKQDFNKITISIIEKNEP